MKEKGYVTIKIEVDDKITASEKSLTYYTEDNKFPDIAEVITHFLSEYYPYTLEKIKGE